MQAPVSDGYKNDDDNDDFFAEILPGVHQDMSERSGGEILEESTCISQRSQRSARSQRSEKSQRSQFSETFEKFEKTERIAENTLDAFALNVRSESKIKAAMHPMREVGSLFNEEVDSLIIYN